MHVVQLHHALCAQNMAVPVWVLSFAPLPQLQQWLDGVLFAEANRELFSATGFLSDPSLTAYHAYGLGQNSFLRVYGARVLWHYVKLYARGQMLPKSKQDTLQRGGDFVVAGDGRMRLAYVGKDQSDRPATDMIMRALRQQSRQ